MSCVVNRFCLAVSVAAAVAACSSDSPERPASTNRPPALTIYRATTDEDVAVDLHVLDSVSDPDGDALRITYAEAGEHRTEVVGGQLVRLIPKQDFHGAIEVGYLVTDGSHAPLTGHAFVTVRSVNDAPVATPQAVPAAEDTGVDIALAASDADGDPLTFQIGGVPSHGTLSAMTGARVTYTPAPDYHGPDSFTFIAFDGTASSTPATVDLDVDGVPSAMSFARTTAEDTAIAIAMLGSDPEDDPLIFAITRNVAHGFVSGLPPNVTYTPGRDFHGDDSFEYTVTARGVTSAPATVTLQVTPVNDPPTPRDDFVATDVDIPLTFSAAANDIDIDGDRVALAQVDPPAHGTAAIVDGKIAYTPTAGFTGVDVFAYTVDDGRGGSARGSAHVGVGAFPPGAPTERVSIGFANTADPDDAPAISDDSRYVAFVSFSALVDDDTNGESDVYVYDRATRTVTRVSVASDGTEGDRFSGHPRISSNGRYVVFDSDATNLVSGDTNTAMDVFRHDRVTGQTVRISVAGDGAQATGASSMATISDDGNRIAFSSRASNLVPGDANAASDVFVRDLAAGTTIRASVSPAGGDGDHPSQQAVISGDGHRVAFVSGATNLVADDTNNLLDVFVRDLVAGTTVRASVGSTGEQPDASCDSSWMSRDGRVVSFLSRASNLVSPPSSENLIYIRDTLGATTTRPTMLPAFWARLSGDGHFMVEQTTTGIFVVDLVAHAQVRIAGPSLDFLPVLSANGQYVVLYQDAGTSTVAIMPNPLAR